MQRLYSAGEFDQLRRVSTRLDGVSQKWVWHLLAKREQLYGWLSYRKRINQEGVKMPSPNADQYWHELREASEWAVSRRTVLKAGAITSGGLALGDATGRAVARRVGKAGFSEGTPVVDGDDPDPDTALVINVLDVPISDWFVYGNETVADQNPGYDPEDQVVIVAFEHLLDREWANWRRTPPHRLFDGVVDRGIKFHAFPQARLKRGRPTGVERSSSSGPTDIREQTARSDS